jgi:hypothetical protein
MRHVCNETKETEEGRTFFGLTDEVHDWYALILPHGFRDENVELVILEDSTSESCMFCCELPVLFPFVLSYSLAEHNLVLGMIFSALLRRRYTLCSFNCPHHATERCALHCMGWKPSVLFFVLLQ